MFERILLPMDGSLAAESALPFVRNLVNQLQAEVTLIHICPPEHQEFLHMHQIYLTVLVENLRKEMALSQASKVKTEVIQGDPVKEILEYIRLNKIDTVILTSRGSSGTKYLGIGNVADKIIRTSGTPTILIRVKDGINPPLKDKLFEKILVPLDTSEGSKITIPYIIELARKLGAGVTLFSLTKTVYSQNYENIGAGIGVNWDVIDNATLNFVNNYLQEIENEIKKSGINANHSTYLGVDSAQEILEMEKKTGADMVVMATHARSQIARWALGSVAEKILHEGTLPLLLIKQP